jgi:hypothetical protein
MPSSTSNSEFEVYDRPVPELKWGVAGALAMLVFLAAFGAWEMHWRAWGAQPTYRNSEGLWATQRRRANAEPEKTVLVGSSRTLSNFNLDVWQKVAGERPIQLALEGTSPMTVLEGLANDPNYNGKKIVIGVTPLLFFTGFEYRTDVLKYYPKETPSQRFSQWLSMTLIEPYFAYNDPDFAIFPILKRQAWPARMGVRANRDVRRLFTSSTDRNMRMWEKVETDAAYQKLCQDIWREFWDPPDMKMLPEIPKMQARQMERAEKVAQKLKERGIKAVFVLHPMEGEFKQFEMHAMARERNYDELLRRTGLPGLHFEDHPEMQGYWIPEWSHMARADADRYTAAVYPLIKQKLEGR